MVKSGAKWRKERLKMLMGEFQHNLDAKGRLFMPVKLREALGTKFVLTKGLDGCLFVYDLEQWRLLEAKLNSLPMTRKAPVILTVSFLAVLPKVSAINRDGYFYLLICASLQDWIKMPLLSALATGLRSGTQNAGTHITKKMPKMWAN